MLSFIFYSIIYKYTERSELIIWKFCGKLREIATDFFNSNLKYYLVFPGYQLSDIITIGITNQRETTIVWDKTTGEPLYNAIGKNFNNILIY